MTNEAATSADPSARTLAAVESERSAVVYLRVSSKRQMDTAADIDTEGNSIATQRQVCQSKVDKMGATIVREFVEPGTSAQTIEKRPVFRQMLAYLVENPNIDYVVIYMRRGPSATSAMPSSRSDAWSGCRSSWCPPRKTLAKASWPTPWRR